MNKIEYSKNPSASDIDFLTQQINQETAEYGEAYPFAFFIRDDEAHIIAGANGFVIYGAIYTDQLWVHKGHRGQGFARKIMDKVHEFGALEGCKIATVQTMSFQGAQAFYEKLAYVQDFKRTGYVNSSNCIFMRKAL
jgi:GNAT superfamily N-acetyltransferase